MKINQLLNENWDTEEMSRWVANDEGLYSLAQDVRNGMELKKHVLNSGFSFKDYGINSKRINWDIVLADNNDEYGDSMDAFDMGEMQAHYDDMNPPLDDPMAYR